MQQRVAARGGKLHMQRFIAKVKVQDLTGWLKARREIERRDERINGLQCLRSRNVWNKNRQKQKRKQKWIEGGKKPETK